MAFTVIYDACVLYPNYLRDLLIRLARAGAVRARWTEEILSEVRRNLHENRGIDPKKLQRLTDLMTAAVPDCIVTEYDELEPSVELPDPDDLHVLAAALRAGAQQIVTANLKDFPETVLAPLDVEAVSPDQFVLNLVKGRAGVVVQVVTEAAGDCHAPPLTVADLLSIYSKSGLIRSAAAIRDLMES